MFILKNILHYKEIFNQRNIIKLLNHNCVEKGCSGGEQDSFACPTATRRKKPGFSFTHSLSHLAALPGGKTPNRTGCSCRWIGIFEVFDTH